MSKLKLPIHSLKRKGVDHNIYKKNIYIQYGILLLTLQIQKSILKISTRSFCILYVKINKKFKLYLLSWMNYYSGPLSFILSLIP